MVDPIVIIGLEHGRAYHKIGHHTLPEHLSLENGMPKRVYWRVPQSVAEEMGYDPCCWCCPQWESKERCDHVEMNNSGLGEFV